MGWGMYDDICVCIEHFEVFILWSLGCDVIVNAVWCVGVVMLYRRSEEKRGERDVTPGDTVGWL